MNPEERNRREAQIEQIMELDSGELDHDFEDGDYVPEEDDVSDIEQEIEIDVGLDESDDDEEELYREAVTFVASHHPIEKP